MPEGFRRSSKGACDSYEPIQTKPGPFVNVCRGLLAASLDKAAEYKSASERSSVVTVKRELENGGFVVGGHAHDKKSASLEVIRAIEKGRTFSGAVSCTAVYPSINAADIERTLRWLELVCSTLRIERL